LKFKTVDADIYSGFGRDITYWDYEYSIDGINYQDSNTYRIIKRCDYIVYVKDKNECGNCKSGVSIWLPKIFTQIPMGDTVINFRHQSQLLTLKYRSIRKIYQDLNATSSWMVQFNGHQPHLQIIGFQVTRARQVYKGHFP
jgi:hypothetical protein